MSSTYWHKQVLVTQSCPTLYDPMDGSPPGCSVHGFSWQESWSGLPYLSPGDLPDLGMEPGSAVWQADSLLSKSPGKPTYRPMKIKKQ